MIEMIENDRKKTMIEMIENDRKKKTTTLKIAHHLDGKTNRLIKF